MKPKPLHLRAQARLAAKLADAHTHELGWLPHSVYEHAAGVGQLVTPLLNNTPCGFILRGPWSHTCTLHQAFIDEDARLQDVARSHVLQLVAAAAAADVERIVLHCAMDLPANDFWRATGFEHAGTRPKLSKTARDCHRWEWVFQRGRDIDQHVEAQLANKATRALADYLGVTEALRQAFARNYRRRPGPR